MQVKKEVFLKKKQCYIQNTSIKSNIIGPRIKKVVRNGWKQILAFKCERKVFRDLVFKLDMWLDFRDLGSQCEIIIAGSGYFGYSRDVDNESNNRKFSIQVTSKVGKILNNNDKK